MLVNVFYRREFGRVDVADVKASDYDYVCDLQVTGETPGLEYAFREMNAVDGTETCCKLRVRSMSVGDVVVMPGGAFLCMSTGWNQITEVADFAARVKVGDFAT